jgi:hypothetical protein
MTSPPERPVGRWELNELASETQNLIASQPWGTHGNQPVPLTVTYNERNGERRWTVKYVQRVTSSKRVYAYAQGETLDAALLLALDAHRRVSRSDNIAYHR